MNRFYACCMRKHTYYAIVAQLVERHLAKVEIAGSSPVYRSFLLPRKSCIFQDFGVFYL